MSAPLGLENCPSPHTSVKLVASLNANTRKSTFRTASFTLTLLSLAARRSLHFFMLSETVAALLSPKHIAYENAFGESAERDLNRTARAASSP